MSAQQMIPFPQPPSVAYMERQSGSIPIEWMAERVKEYRALGCEHIGISVIDSRLVNVWCVRIEVFR